MPHREDFNNEETRLLTADIFATSFVFLGISARKRGGKSEFSAHDHGGGKWMQFFARKPDTLLMPFLVNLG